MNARIKPKTPAEIAIMRKACTIVGNLLIEIEDMVKPGVSTKDIDQFAYNFIRKHNAKPSFKGYGPKHNRFPGSVCASVNAELIHGFPNKTPLVEGDIVSIDVGAFYKGYHSDTARTYFVGEVSENARRLVETTEKAFYAGAEEVKAGVHLGNVSNAVQRVAEDAGYSIVREFAGHGLGTGLHEPPQVNNYGEPGTGPILPAGTTFALEPMLCEGARHIEILDDGWTVVSVDGKLTAHYEHTVLVTDDGYELLTKVD